MPPAPPYENWMQLALRQARQAAEIQEVPIGAVVVDSDGTLLAEAHNLRIEDSDPTAHAEILALRAAAKKRGDWRLSGCTLVVTLEPCCMCAAAAVLARIDRLVYGATDPKAGGVESLYRLCTDDRLNHQIELVSGILAEPCGQILRDFFAAQRARGKK